MFNIEVPFMSNRNGSEAEMETAGGDTTLESEHSESSGRRRSLHRGESVDTHQHFVASDHPDGILYRHQELQAVLDAANQAYSVEQRQEHNKKVMEKLADLGVSVFLISHECDDVWKEVKCCIFEASGMALYECSTDKCLLYEDEKGRLFNLLVAGDFGGLSDSWKSNLTKSSGLEAVSAVVVLIRAFGCVDLITGIRPAYITLILGLVLTEEISNSWINASMLVWGMPSISAFALTQPLTIDWPKQLVLFTLALAAVADSESEVQQIMTLAGIGWGCAVLLANLGARAWRTLRLSPLPYRGPFRTVAAFLVAVLTGLMIPYIGFRQTQGGGQLALETVIISAFLVAVVFVISDFDVVQEFFVAGSESCNQDPVNFGVGIWWFITVLTSMYFSRLIPSAQRASNKTQSSKDDSEGTGETPYTPEPEPLVIEDQDSPVGYRVKQIPDFMLDPRAVAKPHLPASFMCFEMITGLVMAVVVGGLIVFTAFTDKDDEVTSQQFGQA